jgi:hypothetical protein
LKRYSYTLRRLCYIWLCCHLLAGLQVHSQPATGTITVRLFGDSVVLPYDSALSIPFDSLSSSGIEAFGQQLNNAPFEPLITALSQYRQAHQLNDWLYYQLIRSVATTISPKAANYHRYTLYKWFLLCRLGYNAALRIISGNRLLLYVQSNDSIYNIPVLTSSGQQYVCLNYHDYDNVAIEQETTSRQLVKLADSYRPFSYEVSRLPEFSKAAYTTKSLRFKYKGKARAFNIVINSAIKDIFVNYPVMDFAYCFNIPLSRETYSSLMPDLKAAIAGMDERQGIDYLMHFTRYAFAFEKDAQQFGKEKRLAPEETLLYTYSDCEDRAALFFYLVKELYNLPMLTLLYPEHVTVAVQLSQAGPHTLTYKGRPYTVCEPTPQDKDLKMGQLPEPLRRAAYDIGYEYNPQ